MAIRIGICTGIDNLAIVEAIGFDYLEWAVSAAASMSTEDFNKVKTLVDTSSIKCEAFNLFFPGNMRLTGPDTDEKAISEYIKAAMERISLLGAKVAVVGSGKARNVPEGYDMAKGLEQFASVLAMIGREAVQYGITALVEPLNTGETNVINSVLEGKELVERVNHPSVKLLADFYHMRRESEDMNSIRAAGNLLRHLHIANSNGRIFPANAGEDAYAPFFAALKDIAYDGRISIEASTNNFDADARASLKLLRSLCSQVQSQ